MWSRRMERVNELLLREISSFVLERQDPEIGFVTFTGVEVTEDLMQAKVFYSVLGNEEEKSRAAAALDSLTPELRRSMRHLESLRRIPALTFIYDDTPAKATRVFEILEKLHEEDAPPSDSPEPPESPKGRLERKKKH
jgi:ribosome-binding factor A